MRRDKRGEKKSGGKGREREGSPLVVLYSLYRTLSTQCFRMSVKLATM